MCFPLISCWRWELVVRAQVWRALMALGMNFHRMPHPRPRAPSFRKRIKTTISPQPGEIDLLFYTPTEYRPPILVGTDKVPNSSNNNNSNNPRGYPAVVNFHGGGFTLGRASDDARWADAVVRRMNAVVISVEYRLAPEHPFPTAVEDGVDAVLYLINHSEELGIDPHRIATSGFSAGGNLAFTVPLKLQAVINNPDPKKEEEKGRLNSSVVVTTPPIKLKANPIVAIAAFYPVTDFATYTRPQRRLKSIRPEKDLPQFFTELFDASYLHPLAELSLSSPYLSPGLAPVQMLKALPDHIVLYTCEWDELRIEAERMRDRLTKEAGKEVVYRKVDSVAHAWDKSPNPLKWDQSIDEIYGEACAALKQAFDVASHEN
ncbi:unnamed protein product [Calypogeia fissa]